MLRFKNSVKNRHSVAYDPKTGNVEYRTVKDSIINRFFDACRRDVESSYDEDCISVPGGIFLITLIVWIITYITYLVDYITPTSITYITVFLWCCLQLTVVVNEKTTLLFVPFIVCGIFWAHFSFGIPFVADIHLKHCKCAQEIVRTKTSSEKFCIYKEYYLQTCK